MKALPLAIVLASVMTSTSAIAHSFCKILKDGPALDGQVGRFRSRYYTDHHDIGSFFSSDACKGTIGDITESGKGDESVRQFDEKSRDLFPKEFIIEITGIFRWNRNWHPPWILSTVIKPGPHGELEVTHVWKFREIRSSSNSGCWRKANLALPIELRCLH